MLGGSLMNRKMCAETVLRATRTAFVLLQWQRPADISKEIILLLIFII